MARRANFRYRVGGAVSSPEGVDCFQYFSHFKCSLSGFTGESPWIVIGRRRGSATERNGTEVFCEWSKRGCGEK